MTEMIEIKTTEAGIEAALRQFYGGGQQFYRPMFPRFKYTEGVMYLQKSAKAFWLVDEILIRQMQQKVKAERFQVWTLKVQKDRSAKLEATDGNHNKIFRAGTTIPWTDFPLESITLWMVDGVLMLPSEY
jgi:hypothetical protein